MQRDCPVLQRPLGLALGAVTFIILRAHMKCDSLGGPVPVTWSLDPNPHEVKTLPVSALDSWLSDFSLKGNAFVGVSQWPWEPTPDEISLAPCLIPSALTEWPLSFLLHSVSLKTQSKSKFPFTTQEAAGDWGLALSLIDLCITRSPTEGWALRQTRHQVPMKNLAFPPLENWLYKENSSSGPACVKREHLSLLRNYDTMAG